MTLEILPPSPNWYLTSSCDIAEDGTFIFATKSDVYILDISVCPPTLIGTLCGHSERVTGVSCCRTVGAAHLCATAGDDAIIKIWDLRNRSLLQEKKCLENKITAIDWPRGNKDVVIAGDEKGFLICWNIRTGDAKLLKPDRGAVYSIACNPHDSKIVAVGYRDGKILIVDTQSKKDQVVQSLKGHSDEVQSLVWAPYLGEEAFLRKKPPGGGEEEEEESCPAEPGCLLISGSRDKTIRVWSSGQGKLLKVLNLPPRGGGGQRPRDRGDEPGMKARVWVGLHWPEERPDRLVASSHGGDMVVWDLTKPSQPRWEIMGGDAGDSSHHRSVFNIVGRSCDPERVITTSMDRQVICWNLSTMKPVWSLPTLGGFVYCIAPSPLDPARLAVGVGDSMIRVWNTWALGRVYEVMTLWQGIKSKVTVVCWHPLRENCLAYGTEDGRVGVYNVSSHGKPPQLSWTFHKKTVYTLSWGPPCPQPEKGPSQSHHLYSCGGEGLIYQHNPAKLDQEATNINDLIKQTNNIQHLMPQRSDVAWTNDGRAVAIGNEDGSIEMFAAPDFRLLCVIHVQNKIINCLQWHPECQSADQSEALTFIRHQSQEQSSPLGQEEVSCDQVSGDQTGDREGGDDTLTDSAGATRDSPDAVTNGGSLSADIMKDQSDGRLEKAQAGMDQSEQRYWLASGSIDHDVEVYDLGNVLGNADMQPLSVPITSSYRTLTGHSARVTALAWSPHGDGRLVTTSYDNSAQVWDVPKGEPLANFRGHGGRVFSCAWSCSDPDTLMTGGEDFCLMKWSMSKVTHTKPPKTSRKPFKKSGKKGKKSTQVRSQGITPSNSNGGAGLTEAAGLDSSVKATGERVLVNQDAGSSQMNHHGDAGMVSGGLEDAKLLLERKKRELLAQVEEIQGRMEKEEEERGQQEGEGGGTEDKMEESEVGEESTPDSSQKLSAVLDRLSSAGISLSEEPQRAMSQGRGTVKDLSQPGGRKGRPKKFKSLFPLSGAQDNRGKAYLQQDCINLARFQQGLPASQPPTNVEPATSGSHLGLFTSRKMTLQLINDEVSQHAESGNFDQECQLQLWKGNILHPLREAIKQKQLTDWLVAMAPLAGHDVWLHTCEAYARQLESQENYHRAVTYYLMCHRVYEAVALLKKQNMFRDAIALAQVRLLPSDPVLHDLYMTWAGQLETSNSYEPAARCYLAIHEPLNAIKLLARKGDTAALATALHVAILSCCTEDGLVVSIATRYLTLSLATGRWKQAWDVFSLHTKYKVHACVVLVYELLVWCLIHQGHLTSSHDIQYTDIYTEISPSIQWEDSKRSSWPSPSVNGSSLLDVVFHRADMSCDQSHDQLELDDINAMMSGDTSHSINKVLRAASQQIVLSHLGQRSGQKEVTVSHLIQAVRLCHVTGHPRVAVGLLQLMFPHGEKSLGDFETKFSPGTKMDFIPITACMRAHFSLTQLFHIRMGLMAQSSATGDVVMTTDSGKECLGKNMEDGIKIASVQGGDGSASTDTVEDVKTGAAECREDDGDVALNPRTEGFLFQDELIKRDPSWPVLPSAVPMNELLAKYNAAVGGGGEGEISGSGDRPHSGKSGCKLTKEEIAARMHAWTNRTPQKSDVMQRNSESNAAGIIDEDVPSNDVIKEGGDSGTGLALPADSTGRKIRNGMEEEDGDDMSLGATSSKEPSTKDGARGLDAIMVVRDVLLEDRYALPCIACSKLSQSTPSEGAEVHLGDVSMETVDGRMLRGIASLEVEDLRKMAEQAQIRDGFATLRRMLQGQVKDFPDPVSSCIALISSALQYKTVIQSEGSMADQLLKQLVDWSVQWSGVTTLHNA